jgi:hypothetical protein
MRRTRTTVTPQYPGSFFAEEGHSIEIPDAEPRTALAAVQDDGAWFALEVRTTTQKRWTDGNGGELWVKEDGVPSSTYRIYIGEALTTEDVEKLPGDNSILLANMRSNGWDPIIRTRRGNFQPFEEGDVVLTG